MWKKESVPGGVKVGNLFFSSGRACDPNEPTDVETQIKQTMENLKNVLVNAGTSMENVVKATVYLKDLSDRERYLNKIWKEYFPKDPPARTTLGNIDMGIYAVEIEMVAVLP